MEDNASHGSVTTAMADIGGETAMAGIAFPAKTLYC